MNRIIRAIMLMAVAIGLLAMPVTFTGCGTTLESRQAVSFQTLKSVQIAVDSAMKVYAVAAVTGAASLEKQREIDNAHAQYRTAFATAVHLARNDLTQIAPEEIVALATQLQVMISRL